MELLMASLFVAVIFFCVKGACDFAYSPTMYSTHAECVVSVHREVQVIKKSAPEVTLQSACLEFKIPGA